jgi:two-component system, OmpR family, alkaline phosphatase synthesis response regulator PhoP
VARRVLVIDDEDDIREVAQVSLEILAGLEVILARSGSEGITKAQQEQPDAILLDVMLPDMDGVATFEHLQADPTTRHIPVILLTAKTQASDQQRFADLGIRAVINKPFKPAKLADQVLEILGWNR